MPVTAQHKRVGVSNTVYDQLSLFLMVWWCHWCVVVSSSDKLKTRSRRRKMEKKSVLSLAVCIVGYNTVASLFSGRESSVLMIKISTEKGQPHSPLSNDLEGISERHRRGLTIDRRRFINDWNLPKLARNNQWINRFIGREWLFEPNQLHLLFRHWFKHQFNPKHFIPH